MSRKISARWTDRVPRGSDTLKIARYRQVQHDASVPRAGRRMTVEEAMEFALTKYEVALHRLAQNS